MKFTLVAILSAVATAVYAQTADVGAGIAVNSPGLGQVVNAGTPLTIKWTVTPGTSNNINTIALMSGNAAHLDVITQNILTGPIPATPSEYVWNIPANTPTMPSYAFALTGDNGGVSYSPYFTILGAAPGTNTTAPSSSAAPVASASGSTPVSSGATPSASNSTASPSATKAPNAGNNLKAGVACAAGVAGAVALLL